jgi:hypothetical protein
MILNGLNNERTFQVNENTPSIPSLIRKSTESLRMTKQDNNNNNIERSTSLQVWFFYEFKNETFSYRFNLQHILIQYQ